MRECVFARSSVCIWSAGAAGAQVPYKHKVGGSNPSPTTINSKRPTWGAFILSSDTLLGTFRKSYHVQQFLETQTWSCVGR